MALAKTERALTAPVGEPAPQATVGKDRAESKPWRSFGEQFMEMYSGHLNREQMDPRLLAGVVPAGSAKSALPVKFMRLDRAIQGGNVGMGYEGGFLVGIQKDPGLWTLPFDVGSIVSKVDKRPSLTFDQGRIYKNAFRDNSRVTGSRLGGMQVYHKGEAGEPTAAEPGYRQLVWSPIDKGIRGLYPVTEEESRIPEALGNDVMSAWRDEITWTLDHDAFWGTGAGQWQGGMYSNCKLSVDAEDDQDAATIVTENILNMYSHAIPAHLPRYAWFCGMDCLPQLQTLVINVGTGGAPLWMPPSGLASAPNGTILGLPVIFTEHNAALGTAGDIVLACMNPFFRVYDLGDVETAMSVHVYFVSAQSLVRFMYWSDGQMMLENYITPATGSHYLSPFIYLATRS
jgi:HK97 family phage major capsid protein